MYCVSDGVENDFCQGASLISIHAKRLKISDALRKQNDSIWYCYLSDSWVVCKAVSKVKESLKLLLKSSNHLAINHDSLATNTDSNFCRACSRIWPAKYWPITARVITEKLYCYTSQLKYVFRLEENASRVPSISMCALHYAKDSENFSRNSNGKVRFGFFQPEYSHYLWRWPTYFWSEYSDQIHSSVFNKPVLCPNKGIR